MMRNILVRISTAAAILLSIAIAAVLAAVYLWPKHYTLILNNFTNDRIIINSIKLDGDVVFDGEKEIDPKITQEQRRYGRPGMTFNYMRSADPRLTVNGRLGGGGEIKLACELKDSKGAGCRFFVTIKGAEELVCICDSYSDFLN